MTHSTLKAIKLLSCTFLVGGLVACSQAETATEVVKDAPRAVANSKVEIAVADLPKSVKNLVMSAREGFEIEEILKKTRDGRVYYDVEGELPSGDEIEFDVLMTDAGPEIVEIQRDILWRDVPRNARVAVNKVNTEKLSIARIIESVQTDESIIYEIFVKDHKSEPRFEAHVIDGEAKILASRWKH